MGIFIYFTIKKFFHQTILDSLKNLKYFTIQFFSQNTWLFSSLRNQDARPCIKICFFLERAKYIQGVPKCTVLFKIFQRAEEPKSKVHQPQISNDVMKFLRHLLLIEKNNKGNGQLILAQETWENVFSWKSKSFLEPFLICLLAFCII